jgi:plasmid replication initiation protein
MLKKTSTEIVVQSNYLVESSYRLNFQEKRLIAWLSTKIRKDDVDFKKYRVSIKEFAQEVNLDPNSQYREMKKLTASLITRLIQIEDQETGKTKQMAWLCFAEWDPKMGICDLKFHPDLKPYLLQLNEKFTIVKFNDYMKLDSAYSMRILELLVQYESIGQRKTTIKDIRAWCGIRKDEYKFYKDLRCRVIDRAKTEINAKTEYDIDYTEIKESRKVVAIEWTIKKKPIQLEGTAEKVRQLQKEYRSESALIDSLVEYGFSRSIAKRFITNNGEDVVSDALKSVNIQVERATVKNPRAMIQTAIKERWKPDAYKKRKVG